MKKLLIILTLSLVFIGSIYIYIQYNLARYSVYYASHMPRKEGARPELVMAVENKNFIDEPNGSYVYFDEEHDHTIYFNNNAYFTNKYGGYYLTVDKKNGLYFYHTNLTGKFIFYYSPDDSWEEKSIDNKIIQEIEGILAPATQDLIKAQKTPSINLQKLFNQKYESRFNE